MPMESDTVRNSSTTSPFVSGNRVKQYAPTALISRSTASESANPSVPDRIRMARGNEMRSNWRCSMQDSLMLSKKCMRQSR